MTGTAIAADNVVAKFRLIWGKMEGSFEPGDDYSWFRGVLESGSEWVTGKKDTGYWVYQGITATVGGGGVVMGFRSALKGKEVVKNTVEANLNSWLLFRQKQDVSGTDDDEFYKSLESTNDATLKQFYRWLLEIEKK